MSRSEVVDMLCRLSAGEGDSISLVLGHII